MMIPHQFHSKTISSKKVKQIHPLCRRNYFPLWKNMFVASYDTKAAKPTNSVDSLGSPEQVSFLFCEHFLRSMLLTNFLLPSSDYQQIPIFVSFSDHNN